MADKLFWVAAGSWVISFLVILAYSAGRTWAEPRMGIGGAVRATEEDRSGRHRVRFDRTLLQDMVVAAGVSLIPAGVGFVLAFVLEGVWG